jgi:uncharacterized protein (TIGR00251 family)
MSASTRIRLRVAPGAAGNAIVGRHGDGWKVRVAAAPERGKANDALIGLLAETLLVPRSDLVVVSGLGSRDKIVAVTGLDPSLADAALARAAATPESA